MNEKGAKISFISVMKKKITNNNIRGILCSETKPT